MIDSHAIIGEGEGRGEKDQKTNFKSQKALGLGSCLLAACEAVGMLGGKKRLLDEDTNRYDGCRHRSS